jgi:hypothetical protein
LKELGAQRRQRWDKAFSEKASQDDDDHQITTNRKATIVLEHLMQASPRKFDVDGAKA